jgi:hypothetical protein
MRVKGEPESGAITPLFGGSEQGLELKPERPLTSLQPVKEQVLPLKLLPAQTDTERG